MIYGVLMVLVVYFLPEGIVPAVRNWWTSRGKSGDTSKASTPATEGAAS